MRTTTTRVLDLCDYVKTFMLVLLVSGIAITALPDPVLTPTSSTIAPVAAVVDVPSAPADPNEILRLPEGAALETTPMVPVEGTRYVVPEESPDGGRVLPLVLWLDNSPVYSGPQTWVLHVDDSHQPEPRVTWRLYSDVVDLSDIQLGA